jgi:hypothetical protein
MTTFSVDFVKRELNQQLLDIFNTLVYMMTMVLLFVSKLPSIICTIVSFLYQGVRTLVDCLKRIPYIINTMISIHRTYIQLSTQARSLNNLVRIGYSELKNFGVLRKVRFEELVIVPLQASFVCSAHQTSDPVVKAQHDIDDFLSHNERVWDFMIESLIMLGELDTYKAIVSYNLQDFDNMLCYILSILKKAHVEREVL